MIEQTAKGTDIASKGQPSNTPNKASVQEPLPDASQPLDNGDNSAIKAKSNEQNQSAPEVVFDPDEFKQKLADLPDDVKSQVNALHKQLLSDYTKKTQSVADIRKAAEAYQAFQQDPHKAIKQVAKQLGYELHAPGQQSNNNDTGNGWNPDSGDDPQTWKDVIGYITKSIESRFDEKLNPFLNEIQSVKKHSIENQLSEIDPSWQTYESQMKANLQEHPSLAKDPALLYRISVPAEVLESRATQRALKRMEAKAKSGELSGASTTTRKPRANEPEKALSFADAVNYARKKLAEEGLNP